MWRLIIVFLFIAPAASAVECQSAEFEQDNYTICKVQPAKDQLRLFLQDPERETPLGSFNNVDSHLEKSGQSLVFAMNAGMYHRDRSPVGHYIEDGEVAAPLITREGPGNFGLLPNGVFCIGDSKAEVFETLRFKQESPSCQHATQSGPMLLIDGAIHPRFLADSDSLFIRNGVGSSPDGGTVWFAISENPVNFYTFARLFRDHLQVDSALYFDGNISRLYAPQLDRHDGGFPMGPIVGVVADKPD